MAASKLRACARLWSPLAALRSLVTDGARSEGALTGVRALALLHVIAQHAVILASARGSDFSSPALFSGAAAAGSAPRAEQQFFTSWLAQPVMAGDVGVDAFFVLSGYLIALMWLKEVQRSSGGRFNYPRFMARRFLRIWPAMALALGATWGFMYAIRGRSALAAFMNEQCRDNWWTVLTFTNNFRVSLCLGQTWSVATEMQMYLVTPFVTLAAYSPAAAAPRRFGLALLAALSLVGVAINVAVFLAAGSGAFGAYNVWPLPLTYTMPFTRSPPYFAGMCACVVVDSERKRRRQRDRQEGAPEPTPKPAQAVVITISEAENDADALARAPAACSGEPAALLPASAAAVATAVVDWGAVAVLVALQFTGVGHSAFVDFLAPEFGLALKLGARWLFGWALARVFVAVLLGRLRAVNALLTLRALVPAATISYSAYLLQDLVLVALPSWAQAGVTTAYAAWAVWTLNFAFAALGSLALALPSYVLVERPFSLLLPRSVGGGGGRGGSSVGDDGVGVGDGDGGRLPERLVENPNTGAALTRDDPNKAPHTIQQKPQQGSDGSDAMA